MIEPKFIELIAGEVNARPAQVAAAIELFDRGSTVPFVARYRKDVTGNLDEVKLEAIETRNIQCIALINRRDAILGNIAKQGKLTDELRARIEAAEDQTTLEDLYLPFRKQRRTKASVARERGLEPLADFLWAQVPGDQTIESHAAPFIDSSKSISSPEEALEGARHILSERVAMDADVRAFLRDSMRKQGKVKACATKTAEGQRTKFEAYYDFTEDLKSIPSHRLLAVLRGARMGVLRMDIVLDDDALVQQLVERFIKAPGTAFEEHIRLVVADAYRRLLRPAIENEVVGMARKEADEEAIHVFRENAEALLLAPPAGRIVVLGADPGIRSGSKLAVVDNTGAYIESATIFPTEPKKDEEGAEKTLLELVEKHGIQAVAIGNGTGSRELAAFINGILKKAGKKDVFTVFVNEAGASIYSASKVAREEFPDLDVTIRGAISIARRLQDPLAELVKLEPRTIGVGQYQHDVNQKQLREGLYRTVESCVNRVGVDLNMASVDLLRYVSGIQMGTAQNIVQFRTEHGGFKNRRQLAEVSGIGEKTYQQCVGFLRITDGDNPLDATSIHPEAYGVVEQVAQAAGLEVSALIRNPEQLKTLDFEQAKNEIIGDLTLSDIRRELLRPGRDPRKEFRVPKFLEGVEKVEDIEEGMEMEGVITNVTDFGAFIDIGVHQDGLVHLSELANRFVRDPREVVKVGDIVRVKVIKVDKDNGRISLSRKALLPPPRPRHGRPSSRQAGSPATDGHRTSERPSHGDAPQRSEDRTRPQRSRGDAPRRNNRKPDGAKPRQDRPPRKPRRDGQRGGGGGKPKTFQSSGQSQMNTLLADQLAALKEQLSGEEKK